MGHMEPTWALSAPDGSYVGPMNLAIRDVIYYVNYSSYLDLSSIKWLQFCMKHFRLDLDVCVTQPQWGINLKIGDAAHFLSGNISNLRPSIIYNNVCLSFWYLGPYIPRELFQNHTTEYTEWKAPYVPLLRMILTICLLSSLEMIMVIKYRTTAKNDKYNKFLNVISPWRENSMEYYWITD